MKIIKFELVCGGKRIGLKSNRGKHFHSLYQTVSRYFLANFDYNRINNFTEKFFFFNVAATYVSKCQQSLRWTIITMTCFYSWRQCDRTKCCYIISNEIALKSRKRRKDKNLKLIIFPHFLLASRHFLETNYQWLWMHVGV